MGLGLVLLTHTHMMWLDMLPCCNYGNGDLPKSVAESEKIVRKLRGSSLGTEHTIAQILANPLSSKYMQSMSVFVEVCRKYHGKAMTAATTPKSSMNVRINGALGEWRDELILLVQLTEDQDNQDSLVPLLFNIYLILKPQPLGDMI
jgi:hypothetical protein